MRHKPKDKGDLAVAKVIAQLMEHGIRCCLPLSEHLPFDLIAVMPDMRTLRRVQVKYRADKGVGAVQVRFESNYYDSKRIYAKPVNLDEIDCYAIYNGEKSETYYLRVNEIPEGAKAVTLRFNPSKNGQQWGIWWAKDFCDPRRMAGYVESLPAIRREISKNDELAVVTVIADLAAQGIQPCVPQSQYVPFDLIAVMPDMKTLHRIRVGYGTVCRAPETDYYAVYNPDDGQVRYFKADAIPTGLNVISEATMLGEIGHLNGAFVG
jgi:hypothetical protein